MFVIMFGLVISTGLIAWMLNLLTRHVVQHHNLYRIQTILITIGVFIPVFGTIFTLFNIRTIAKFNPTPFTAIAGNLVLSWGFLRYHLFDVTPIGRDKVFEAMVEPVVILDNNNLIADANSAMLSLMGKKSDDVIGQPAREIFADFPIPIKQYMQVSYARAEATFMVGTINVFYELTVWPIYDDHKEMAAGLRSKDPDIVEVTGVVNPGDYAFLGLRPGQTEIEVTADGHLVLILTAIVTEQPPLP
jgi:hypothetical protein